MAVNVALSPLQIEVGEALAETVTAGLIVTEMVATEVHPEGDVTVTV